MDVQVYNQQGQKAGTMELPKVFDYPWNGDLVHQVVTSELANRRRGTAHTKGRGEVRGGGRKPWRQKGTGRARHGSIRSPIWKGGGVTHGPRREKNFKVKINAKMAKRALAVTLAAKARDAELLLLDAFVLPEPKTKLAAAVFAKLAAIPHYADLTRRRGRLLLVLSAASATVRRAVRNLPFVEVAEARNITALDALGHKYLVLPRETVGVLERRLG